MNVYSDDIRPLSGKSQALFDSLYLLGTALVAVHIVGRALHGVLDLDIELDLRLSTRRTDADLCVVVTEPLEHVAGLRHVELGRLALGICSLKALVVLPQDDLAAAEFLRRIGAEVLHHLLYLVGSCLARTLHVDSELL